LNTKQEVQLLEDQIIVIVRNTTERRQTEEALEKYRDHLEEMIEQRTKELRNAQEELIKREKLSVLGRLTAIVSHDLRNPLRVIRSSTFYLKAS
jgi:C4-dicarboxylate-specific signal transduction histidine kinase